VNLVESGKRIMVSIGGQAVLVLLLALSVFSIAIICERAVAYLRRGGDANALRAALVLALERGGLEAAADAMRGSRHPAAKVALRALALARGGAPPSPEQAEDAMNAELMAQKTELEAGLGVLATLGANAPFIGLFGTVVGIVGAFDALGHGASAAAGGAAAAQGSMQVMAAIGEALVATAVGIGVAIPAVAAFNAFSRASRRKLAGAEILQREVLAHLHAAARASRRVSEVPPPSSRRAPNVEYASGF
jgi:biopolymer transport protein ExbB